MLTHTKSCRTKKIKPQRISAVLFMESEAANLTSLTNLTTLTPLTTQLAKVEVFIVFLCFSFALLSFFRNFVRICRISINKGSLGNWGKTGLRFGDSILHSAMNCIPLDLWSLATNGTQEWAPDEEPPAVSWLIIGCRSTFGRLLPTGRKKGNHFFWILQIDLMFLSVILVTFL